MELLSTLHWRIIVQQLREPKHTVASEVPQYRQIFDFGPLPTSFNDSNWDPEEFRRRTFPFLPLPATAPAMISPNAWNARVKFLLDSGKITPAAIPTLHLVGHWATISVPPYLQPPGTEPTEGKHLIPPEQIQMALDSLASFVKAGHIAGPFRLQDLPFNPGQLKLIRLFGRPRPHGGKLRLINDLSSPKGRSFNDGVTLDVLNSLHMEIAQLQHVIKALLLCGKEARLSKHDLAEAFQILAVHPSQWPYQVIRVFNSSYFICLKLCYGDRQAAHRFSQFHETIIWKMTAPACKIPRRNLFMCIDDLIVIAPQSHQHELQEFDAEYSKVITDLNLSEKHPDPTGTKAFRNLTKGEVLGVMVDSTNHTWSLGAEKYDKIISATEAVYNINNTASRVPITLRMAQTVVGKYQALSGVFLDIPMWLSFAIMDINTYLTDHPDANTEEDQERNFFFSTQAKKDFSFLRAFLTATQKTWTQLGNPESYLPAQPEVVIHCDASGAAHSDPDQPGPALGIYIPVQHRTTARAISFPLPLQFLLAQDDKCENYHHTTLLEGLSVLATILRFPNTFHNKTVVFVMDNAHFVKIHTTGRSKHLYINYLLRCIKLSALTLNSRIVLHWSKRCQTAYCKTADQLTHQNFRTVPRAVQFRSIEQLPAPLLVTLLTSLNYQSNTFHKLWPRILRYWKL